VDIDLGSSILKVGRCTMISEELFPVSFLISAIMLDAMREVEVGVGMGQSKLTSKLTVYTVCKRQSILSVR